jgi:hypothetical protein
MTNQLADHEVKNALDHLQRLALRAAIAGFLTSFALGGLLLLMQRLAPVAALFQTSFEAVCVLLWPSAVLMIGAKSAHGGAVLFLLAACLNAGYFVFAALFIAAAVDRFRSHSRTLAPVAISHQRSNHQITDGIRAPRPIV